MSAISQTDEYWSEFFGVAPVLFHSAGTEVVPHRGLGEWQGIWFFVRAERCVVSAPPQWVELLKSVALPIDTSQIIGDATLRRLFGSRFAGTIGPAYWGHLLPDSFRPVAHPSVRLLDPSDPTAFDELQRECDRADWEDGGPDRDSLLLAGGFESGRVVALAGHGKLAERVGHPSVIVHPDFRGRGLAAAVVSAVVERALREDWLVLYQTLESNFSAVAVARRLGFEPYARHLAVRLAPEPRDSLR